MTPLDTAHAAMEKAPADDNARLRFYERLADAELFLLLETEEGDALTPRLFDTSEGRFVLAFDREDRLAAFAEGPAPYAALSGRRIAAELAGQDIGLGLNLSVAPSSFLVPAGAIVWLHDTLGKTPEIATAQPETIAPPKSLPEALITGLDAKLATAEGLARMAYLVSVTYPGGRPGHLLALIDARPGAEKALAQAISEALVFSGVEAGELDVAFFSAADPLAAALAKHGLRFDIPQPDPEGPFKRDPAKPPTLR
ncbi:MAG: SseB family protein [Paracoccaceae bacterium]|nr:SseB family protein [Paracoccaceae bacterium]